MVNRAVFLFSANRYPKIRGGDDAWWSRWIAVNFEKSFTRDPDYEMKLFTEAFVSGFLLLVVGRMTAIIKAKELITTNNVEQDWLTDASSGYAFIRDCLERCKGAVIVKKDLYAAYVEYCHDAEFEVESQKEITELLKQAGAIDAYPKINGFQQHCYQGFKQKGLPAIEPDSIKKDADTQHILHTLPGQRGENTPNMQDMQGIFNLKESTEKKVHPGTRNEKVNASNPAYPAYKGQTRQQLTETLLKYGGNASKVPDAETFKEAWKAAALTLPPECQIKDTPGGNSG
jgi:putative DNA primase/helicase